MKDWIILGAYLVLPWAAVWLFGDRERFREAVPGGLVMVIMSMLLDELGGHYGLWRYPIDPFPATAISLPFDLIAFSAEGILISQRGLRHPRQAWFWVIGMALANGLAEVVALRYTRLVHYPAWTPLASVPIYVLLFWVTILFTRWLRRPNRTA